MDKAAEPVWYVVQSLPAHLVVEVGGEKWMVPMTPNAWSQRKPYVARWELRPVPPEMGRFYSRIYLQDAPA